VRIIKELWEGGRGSADYTGLSAGREILRRPPSGQGSHPHRMLSTDYKKPSGEWPVESGERGIVDIELRAANHGERGSARESESDAGTHSARNCGFLSEAAGLVAPFQTPYYHSGIGAVKYSLEVVCLL